MIVKASINHRGELSVRGRKKYCPYTEDAPCGAWCAMFCDLWETYPGEDAHINLIELHCCQPTLVFEDVDYIDDQERLLQGEEEAVNVYPNGDSRCLNLPDCIIIPGDPEQTCVGAEKCPNGYLKEESVSQKAEKHNIKAKATDFDEVT